jgi:DNA-binding HxlR family transcriptional regulator
MPIAAIEQPAPPLPAHIPMSRNPALASDAAAIMHQVILPEVLISAHHSVRRIRMERQQMRNRLAKSFRCPTEFTLNVLGGKWKTVILSYLKERPLRYAELRELIPALSDKMLTQRLHDLIDLGLVSRKKVDAMSDAEFYVLAPRGASLRNVLMELYSWGEIHAPSFGVSVGEPLKERDHAS